MARGGLAERIAELGDLARFHLHGRLREPTHPFAKRLLTQFEVAPFGRLDEDDEQPFLVRKRRNIAQNRFFCRVHGGKQMKGGILRAGNQLNLIDLEI